ncbi:RPA-interacting protein B [Ananas comosus]|uniref:RPA-interacting protein B n=1 Tax=Ananas comosus TaxID=4615 RepID=A0A199VAL6_ANACO|nr:RPA-interacting protein B [Ananas comosus]
MMDGNRPRRAPLKAHQPPNWKEELRQNCLRRVQKERTQLLWKIRTDTQHARNEKEIVESTFRNIVSDELQKIKELSVSGKQEREIDVIWEYNGPPVVNTTETESEELLLEMERLLYEDLREELIRRELEVFEEEDAYLAREVFEHMQLNDTQVAQNDKVWCPICKQGVLHETHHLIFCSNCKLRLDLGTDKVNFDYLRDRLAEAHLEHLDRGCKAAPKFCMETKFGLTALYIQCLACDTFDIVL